jgi:diacylglycerol O-acyltransferase / wax synthase
MSTMMSPADAVWYLGENPANPMMISSILWFDRAPDLTRLRAAIEERLLERHPVFRQRIVPSRVPGVLPRWQDVDDFDLDEHLQTVQLPAPGDHPTLEAACSAERSTPLDRDRPLWCVTVYEGYRGSQCAIHTRIHHSIGDGLALMQLLLTLADEFEQLKVPLTESPLLGREVFELGRRAVSAATQLALHPTAMTEAVREAADAVAWGVKLLAPTLAQRSRLIGHPEGEKRMAWDPDGLPLQPLKDAGHERGVTVNDLLLTVMSGGLHRYLAEYDDLVDDVLMMVPINLRRPGEPLPRHLGNRIGLLPILLPVRAEDPEERLAILRQRMMKLKNSPAPAVSRALLLGTSLATPAVERGIHRLNQLRSTGVVTNVPGPQHPVHIGGARVIGSIGWGGMTGHLNLSAGFISLDGRVFPGFVTDAAITSDPDHLLRHVRDEWEAVIGTPAVDPVSVAAG